MTRKLLVALFFITGLTQAQQNDSLTIRRIFNEALTNGKAYPWLDHITNQIGARLSGSPQASKSISYVQGELAGLHLDSVYMQDVMVPHWMRGPKETAMIIGGGKQIPLTICALGGSIATPKEGLKGNVVEIHDWEDLKKLGKEKIQGKIVFVNHPMKQEFINTFEAYGEAAGFRYASAAKTAPYGAIAVIVRSMTLSYDDFPHTGAMGYVDSVAKIPACAISTVCAEKLSTELAKDKNLQVFLNQQCETGTDVPSYNVIGEIRGSQFPDEIIVVSGHLDSWDLAQGAQDDGAGVVQSMEVLNLLKALHIQPKRTIRCVAYINEENGGKGGARYAELALQRHEKNIAAIESDEGGFSPNGFSFHGDSLVMLRITKWKSLFEPYGLYEWVKGYGGSDINHLEKQGTMLIGLDPDSQRYFDYHHAPSDNFDKVNRRELEMGAASMASLAWLMAEYGIK